MSGRRACQFLAPWSAPLAASTTVRFADGSTPLVARTPLVLAAGAVKYARQLDAFASFGFGAVTVGTATLRARNGNPLKPRAKTLEDDRAISFLPKPFTLKQLAERVKQELAAA